MPHLFAIACLVPAAVLAGGDTGVPRVLIDARLQERPVMLLGVDGREVRYADAGGLERTEPVSGLVAIAPAPGTPGPGAPASAVWLTDGQRFAGALRAGESAPDLVLWRHPALGALDIPMDGIARVALRKPKRGAAAPASETQDVLTLVNGDRLAGFLEAVGAVVRIEVEGTVREVNPKRVAEAAFANPAEPASGVTVWLADGSVVTAASITTSETGGVTIVPAMGRDARAPVTEATDEIPVSALELSDILAVTFDASTLVPLSALPTVAQRPLADRRWTEPMERLGGGVLGAADLVLPGPMTVEWTLPEGASRLAGEAELTPDLWAWGDCELVVSVVADGGRPVEVRRERISAERARVPLNISLAEGGGRLRLTLEPGRYGSIQDRIILRRPMVLLEQAG